MTEKKQKIISRTGMWLATIAGSIYGVIFVVIGYLLKWDHCGALKGPFWKVLLIAFHSVMIGAYIGELIVRKRTQRIFAGKLKTRAITSKLFIIVLLGCMAAFIVSWEVGYIFGKILGTMKEVSWEQILIDIPFVSLIHATPISLVISIIYCSFVFAYLKVGKK